MRFPDALTILETPKCGEMRGRPGLLVKRCIEDIASARFASGARPIAESVEAGLGATG